jgi:hypothetical protein
MTVSLSTVSAYMFQIFVDTAARLIVFTCKKNGGQVAVMHSCMRDSYILVWSILAVMWVKKPTCCGRSVFSSELRSSLIPSA